MKREFICYGTAMDGTVIFTRDINNEVQLFDAERVKGEASRRMCMTVQVGHHPGADNLYICYWTTRNGIVAFARGIDKNVQLFIKAEAESGVKNGNCVIAKVGFIGIGKDGMPLKVK